MKNIVFWLLFTLLVLPLSATYSYAANVVYLKKDCTGVNDCYEDMPTLLNWVWNTRQPSASSPLLVDIGPGSFGPFICATNDPVENPKGFVTLRGSGQDTTTIRATLRSAVSVINCTDLTFDSMSIVNDSTDFTFFSNGVLWVGSGNSLWVNVAVVNTRNSGTSYGWYDLTCSSGIPAGKHYWFASKIQVAVRTLTRAYKSICGETWFYGGEMEAFIDDDTPDSATLYLVDVQGESLNAEGDVRIFGSALRSHIASDAVAGRDVVPMEFASILGAPFHMHGGIINIDASASNKNYDVKAIMGQDGHLQHVVDTAFVVRAAGTGNAYRITDQDTQSPFLWPSSTEPPSIVSTKGSDVFVESDCSSNGDCETAGGNETHMMIYNTDCNTGGGPWFNSTTKRCRGDIQP